MGQDMGETDQIQIKTFSQRLVEQIHFRKTLSDYLNHRLKAVCPNLSTLVGDNVAAKLISQAGSLINLSKAAASTIQILGAEKALFRSLKNGGKTPKYGIIYNSTFIGRAGAKNKGRISRYLANKCAIAARFDQFAFIPTDRVGLKLRDQVDERLRFFATGEKPKTNSDVMKEVLEELKQEGLYAVTAPQSDEEVEVKEEKKEKKRDKKKKAKEAEESEEEAPKKKKKEKKEKKHKRAKAEEDD